MKKLLLLLALLSYVTTGVPAALAAQENEDEIESSEIVGAADEKMYAAFQDLVQAGADKAVLQKLVDQGVDMTSARVTSLLRRVIDFNLPEMFITLLDLGADSGENTARVVETIGGERIKKAWKQWKEYHVNPPFMSPGPA
jgi:hypothetical protein